MATPDHSRPRPRFLGASFTLGAYALAGTGAAQEARFVEVTEAAGIAFVHENGAFGEKYLPETMGSGAAFFDADGDGDQDLLLVNSRRWPGRRAGPEPTPALYRNRGDGTFEDATAGSGLDAPLYGIGAAIADYDADGDQDVYLTALGPNRLLENTRRRGSSGKLPQRSRWPIRAFRAAPPGSTPTATATSTSSS